MSPRPEGRPAKYWPGRLNPDLKANKKCPLDLETVKRVARLARLDIESEGSPSSLTVLAEEMAAIVARIDILNEADAAGAEPLYSPLAETVGPRPDEPGRGASPEDILDQAPARSGRFFAVPKII